MKAVFGAGCFWHVQDEFSKLKGVTNTEAGYMGGDEKKYPNPTYEQVSSHKTGFIEVVSVEFDVKQTSYSELLDLFWRIHDPTSMDRQGLDIGSNYRSVIFYFDEKQKNEAEKSKIEQEKKLGKKVVTEIRPAQTFFRAEEYHQNYYKTCKLR